MCLESPTTPVKQNSKWGGYNLDVAWDHKIYTARKTGEATPFGYNRNTHAPGPGGMTTGCLQYLPPRPLCTVCARKGVDNLLNRTLLVVETSGSTKQVWGLLEQDSIYGRLRRFKYFPAWLA